MRTFVFVSRHTPTDRQHTLAYAQDIQIVSIGDVDAFRTDVIQAIEVAAARDMATQRFAGIICVHPLTAARALKAGHAVGVFQNANRAGPDERPRFEAEQLVVVEP